MSGGRESCSRNTSWLCFLGSETSLRVCELQRLSLTSSNTINITSSRLLLRKSKVKEAKVYSLCLRDTYDELPEELRTKNSIFLDVITQKVLPEATVLITSRPWASGFLHMEHKRQISQRIEVLGFTKTNIESYLENATVSDPTLLADLKKYISCYPHISSLMYIHPS